jgi:hypothetical protein
MTKSKPCPKKNFTSFKKANNKIREKKSKKKINKIRENESKKKSKNKLSLH